MKAIWIDEETGGLIPKFTEIVELSGIVEVDGKEVERFEFLMRPSSAEKMKPEALQVQGRTLEQVMAHPLSQREGYANFLKVLSRYVNKYDKADKFVWFGKNPKFDMDHARELFKTHNDNYFGSWFHSAAVDVASIYIMMVTLGLVDELPNYKLETIAKACGLLKGEQTHKAIDDIILTREVYYYLLKMLGYKPTVGKKKVKAGELPLG